MLNFVASTSITNQYLQTITTEPEQKDYIFLKKQKQLHKIWIHNILWIQAANDCCTISTTQGDFLSSTRLKDLAHFLENRGFIRVHRSFLVNLVKIDQLDFKNNVLHIGSNDIPISKNYKTPILKQITLIR